MHFLSVKHSPPPPVYERGYQPPYVVFQYDWCAAFPTVTVMYPQHFRPAAIVCGDGFRVGMQPEVRPRVSRQVSKISHPRQPHPEVVIHGKVEGRIQWGDLAPVFRPEERSRLRDVYKTAAELFKVCLGGGEFADLSAILVDKIQVAVDHANLGVILEVRYCLTNSAGFVGII